VPSTGARVAIDILCDIMQHATLPADEMAKEKQVILREMDMNQDDPGRRSGRRLFETAYVKSPYRYTVIGYPDIYNELQTEDITAYYRERYAPNNIFFVVVGDIKSDDALAQIRESFSKAKSRAQPPMALPEEPRQTAARTVTEEAPIELGHFHMSWHIPELRHPDVPVIDVLAAILGSGRSSRLYREVRQKLGLANSIDAWTYSPGLPGLFGISALVDADKFASARDAALAEIAKLQKSPVPVAELTKVVKQFISGTLASRKTMQGQAQDLGGSWLSASDLNFSERYLEAVKHVKPADLRRVARQYLTTENRTTYALLPKGTTPKVDAARTVITSEPIQKFELPNGLRLLVKESHRLPFVEFRAVFQGGVLAETAKNNGLTQLMGKMLLKGTKTRSDEEIAREIESIGGSLDSFGGNNSFGVSAEVMSGDFATGLGLMADVILNPTFPAGPLEREREIQLASIKSQKDQLLKSAGLMLRRALFGGAGYGLDTLGTEATVRKLQAADLKSYHKQYAVPNNCVFAIYGDVKPAAVKAAVEKAFRKWTSGSDAKLDLLPSPALEEVKRVSEHRDKKQAVLLLGFPGTTIFAPDRYALELLQEACSDLGSRLFMRIREKLGLAYFVGAQNYLGLAPGYFAFYVGTAPEKAELVETELLREAALLREEGLTAEELKRAKAKVIGQRKIARQDLGSLALSNALDELYGLGYDRSEADDARYEAVALEEVQDVARKYLKENTLAIAIIKPKSP
jgi:zinc protease